jgi:hypothetical protein
MDELKGIARKSNIKLFTEAVVCDNQVAADAKPIEDSVVADIDKLTEAKEGELNPSSIELVSDDKYDKIFHEGGQYVDDIISAVKDRMLSTKNISEGAKLAAEIGYMTGKDYTAKDVFISFDNNPVIIESADGTIEYNKAKYVNADLLKELRETMISDIQTVTDAMGDNMGTPAKDVLKDKLPKIVAFGQIVQ